MSFDKLKHSLSHNNSLGISPCKLNQLPPLAHFEIELLTQIYAACTQYDKVVTIMFPFLVFLINADP